MRGLLLAAVGLAGCATTRPPERILVPPGATIRTAADSLAAHGIIHSTTWFRFRARLAGVSRNVKAGIYQFAPATPIGDLLQALRTGNALRFRVTLPPGGTIFDLARAAEITLGIPHERVIAAAEDSTLRLQFHIPGPSIDGWLRPESFNFGGFDTARDVLVRFLTARREMWDSTWDRRAEIVDLDRASLLTLASIVESEEADSGDRPQIAAVYRNRLQLKMPLQADPTIQYAYLLRDGIRKGELHNKDYTIESPYNTYLHIGLPPGPVGNPSSNAIEAVLSAPKSSYLYFVTGPDGKAVFSRTYDQHLRAIAAVRMQERNRK